MNLMIFYGIQAVAFLLAVTQRKRRGIAAGGIMQRDIKGS
jgi:hypothetical protein